MESRSFTRRALFGWLGALAGVATSLSLGVRSAQANIDPRRGTLGPKELARPRVSQLPTGGSYDHKTQQMKGYELKVADTGTATDEDQGRSTTFWDGEKK